MRVYKPEQFDLIVTREDRKSILIDGETALLPDFLLPRMGAATTYFALAVIRHLERLGVNAYNSSQSIDTVKDKLFTQQILAENNLPVPKTMLVKFPVDVGLVEKYLGFPVVVKTLSGSQGIGVFLAESRANFEDLMQLIEATSSRANIILQEFISSSRGIDLRVFTIGGRVVACMKRESKGDNFQANYSKGGLVNQFDVTPEIERLATETSRILGLDIAGIDLLFDGEHFKVCEANSSPGFEGLEKCCRVNIPQEIYDFIRLRLSK
jgi:gamma-F420-2:alpha-L-glutamate ligase